MVLAPLPSLNRDEHVVVVADQREVRFLAPDGGDSRIEPDVPAALEAACEIAVWFPTIGRSNRAILTKHDIDPSWIETRLDDLTADELLRKEGRR